MKLIIKDNYASMSDWAAQHIADAINKQELDKAIESGNLSIDESTSNLLQKYKIVLYVYYF